MRDTPRLALLLAVIASPSCGADAGHLARTPDEASPVAVIAEACIGAYERGDGALSCAMAAARIQSAEATLHRRSSESDERRRTDAERALVAMRALSCEQHSAGWSAPDCVDVLARVRRMRASKEWRAGATEFGPGAGPTLVALALDLVARMPPGSDTAAAVGARKKAFEAAGLAAARRIEGAQAKLAAARNELGAGPSPPAKGATSRAAAAGSRGRCVLEVVGGNEGGDPFAKGKRGLLWKCPDAPPRPVLTIEEPWGEAFGHVDDLGGTMFPIKWPSGERFDAFREVEFGNGTPCGSSKIYFTVDDGSNVKVSAGWQPCEDDPRVDVVALDGASRLVATEATGWCLDTEPCGSELTLSVESGAAVISRKPEPRRTVETSRRTVRGRVTQESHNGHFWVEAGTETIKITEAGRCYWYLSRHDGKVIAVTLEQKRMHDGYVETTCLSTGAGTSTAAPAGAASTAGRSRPPAAAGGSCDRQCTTSCRGDAACAAPCVKQVCGK